VCMKKNIYLLLLIIVCYAPQLQSGTFDGLAQLIASKVKTWRKSISTQAYQTPAGMVPLSDYHCVGKRYTTQDQVINLEQEIKQGLRYFEFDISTGQKTSRPWNNFFRAKTEQIPVVGSNQRPLLEVITELTAILQKRAYQEEVVIVKLNKPTTDNPGTMHIDKKLQHLLFTSNDLSRLQPTLLTLRIKNKRLALLLEEADSQYLSYENVFPFKFQETRSLFNPDNNYALVRNLAEDIAATNNLNNAAVGSPSFPKVSRSFFSPHFNMYHYVGMDYTSKDVDEIQRELDYGVRGFILPLNTMDGKIVIGTTKATLKQALQTIAYFAQAYNEIVIVHLKNVTQIGEQAVNTIIADPTIQNVLFKPADRLTQANESAAKARILAYEKNTKAKKIWPRLHWNYENKKLIQITWDAPENSKDLWAYNTYYNPDITQYSLSTVQTEVVSLTDFQKAPSTTQTKPVVFYSGVLKAEQRITAAIPFITAITLGFLLMTQKLTDLAFWSLPSIEEQLQEANRQNILHELVGSPKATLSTREQVANMYLLYKMLAAYFTMVPLASIHHGINAAKNTFTIVREEQLPAFSMINGFFINKPISSCIAAKLEGQKTIFDKINYLNRYNYILIDKHAISWTLTLSHLIRKAMAPKV